MKIEGNTRHLGSTLTDFVHQAQEEIPFPPLSEEGKFVIGGLRAKGLAVGLTGRSEKIAQKIAKNPENSQTIKRGVRGLLNILLDTTIDPLDVINGLGEKASEMLQEVREGVVSSIAVDMLMHATERKKHPDTNPEVPKKRVDIDDVANMIMLANDWTTQSRDTRTKVFSFIYTLLYNSAADNPDEKKARRNRFWLPEPAVVKLAVTRQIERQENIGLAFVGKVLSLDAASDETLQNFQQLLAQGLVDAMDSCPTALREIIQRGADIGDRAFRAVENRARAWIEDPERTKRRRYQDDAREDLVTEYLQTSRRAYVEKVLTMAPEFEGKGDVEQNAKWAKATHNGTMLMEAYTKAQEILGQQQVSIGREIVPVE